MKLVILHGSKEPSKSPESWTADGALKDDAHGITLEKLRREVNKDTEYAQHFNNFSM